jgi:hypothetical protein
MRWIIVGMFVAACGGSKTNNPDAPPAPPDATPDVTSASGGHTKFVIDNIRLPSAPTDDAFDLDGDGKGDDRLGMLEQTFMTNGADMQPIVTTAVQQGQDLVLFDVQADDPSLTNANAVGVTVERAVATSPDFSGSGSYTIDSAVTPGTLYGKLMQNGFGSNDPVTTTHPVTVLVDLPLTGTRMLRVHVNGANLTGGFHTGPSTFGGELHGSIPKHDMDCVVLTQYADDLNVTIANDPGSAVSIETEFDVGNGSGGNCAADADCGSEAAGVPGDKVIEPCEVRGNSTVAGVYALDVHVFDASGNYAPSPTGTKDSFSIGLGLHAVGANF